MNETEILKKDGGIPTTLRTTKEQWDQSNSWPLLQYIAVMLLENTGHKDAKILVSEIASKICFDRTEFIKPVKKD
ncbi:unnamed protein product [Macrosiphum euphorbiae]|uniref:Trehalase n=1 Tax=Macrosiphum euphorbiae TaxID=13131 RepID=A0AAV0WMP4_9HEMI|nr:unnamed protein product [Macrosiphum euphorbiae]